LIAKGNLPELNVFFKTFVKIDFGSVVQRYWGSSVDELKNLFKRLAPFKKLLDVGRSEAQVVNSIKIGIYSSFDIPNSVVFSPFLSKLPLDEHVSYCESVHKHHHNNRVEESDSKSVLKTLAVPSERILHQSLSKPLLLKFLLPKNEYCLDQGKSLLSQSICSCESFRFASFP